MQLWRIQSKVLCCLRSCHTSHLAERLQFQGTPEKVSINTVTQKNHDSELTKVKFQLVKMDHIFVSDQYCPDQLDLSEWPHLKDLEVSNAPVDMSEVSILIGQDVLQVHIVLDYCWGDNPQSQPYATKTPLGWCVAGPTNKREDVNKPIALSVFVFDWAENEPVMVLNQQVEIWIWKH